MTDVQFHQLAEIFPLLEGKDFDELVADIKANGQREPITYHKGAILDGRNRYRACIEAGKKPFGAEYDGDEKDLVAFVISANLRRRHMTNEERAKAADRLATLPRGSNQHASIEAPSQAEAAKKFDVTRTAVQRVRKVRSAGAPELVTAFEKGEVSASAAATVASLPVETQRELVAGGAAAVVEAARAIRETPKETVDPAASKAIVDDIDEMLDGKVEKAPTPAEAVAAMKSTFYSWSDESWREYLMLLAELRPVVEAVKPAVSPEESNGEDRLECLECGRRLKTLVRHLNEQHSLTPEGYRAKWGLPPDAPMNTEAHAAVLSEKAANRGRRRSSESRAATACGKPQSPETRAKHGDALRGRKLSLEALAKRSATWAAKRIAKLAAAEQPGAAA